MTLNSEQELALTRTDTVVNAYLYLHTPQLVFEAPLVQAISRKKAIVALQVGTPTVGSWADIGAEMLVQIDIQGTADGGRQRVRGVDVSNNRILVGRSGAGRSDGRLTTNAGGTVRVYKDYRPFIKAPYISPDNLEQYKDETLYTSADAAQPPVACAGTDRFIITHAASASITLNALGPVPSFAVREGAALVSYQWNVDDGTVTAGALNAPSVTVSFPRGARYIRLTVTDSNGISHTTHRLIVVASPEECIPATLETLTVMPTGNQATVRVDSAYLPAGVPTGARAMLAEVENYSGNLIGYSERFTGWVGSESVTLRDARNRITSYTLNLYDIGAFLRSNYLFPQSINIAETLGGWYQMVGANIDRLMHYALQWHTNVLSLASFKPSGVGATYPFAAWTTSGGAVWDDLNNLANAFAHQLTVTSRGILRVEIDPAVAPTAEQAATYGLPTARPSGVVTTLSLDRYGQYTLTAREQPNAFWLEAMALLASNTINDVVSAIAPSNAPSFGTSAPSVNNWLVTSQAELNVWAGNLYAARYSPTITGLTLTTMNPAHFIEPALRQFIAVELPPDVAERYNVLTGDERWTVERITYTYGPAGKRAEYQLAKETAAVAPARTTTQAEEGNIVQTWTGFDTGITPTTGEIVQTIEGRDPLALTEEQLRDVLDDVRLAVYLSKRTIPQDVDFSDGGDGSGGGGGDNNAVANARQSANGGYFEVARRLSNFITQASTYYSSIYVSGAPSERAAFKTYVSALVQDVNVSALDAWTDYLFDTSSVFPTLNATQRATATEKMFCQGGTYVGLVEFAGTLSPSTTPTFERFYKMLPIFQSGVQLAAWYALGTSNPLNFYENYACALVPPDTITYTATNIGNNSSVRGNEVFNWNSRTDGALVRFQISGKYEDANRIVDGFFTYNKATETRTYTPPLLRVIQVSAGSIDRNAVITATPAYNPNNVYDVTLRFDSLTTLGNIQYVFTNNRSVTAPVTGSFTITFTDLGPR